MARYRKRSVLLLCLAVLAACSTDNVLSLRPDTDVGLKTASVRGPGLAALVPPPTDTYVAAYPRLDEPLQSEPAVMPVDEVSCRDDLRRMRVEYRDLPTIDEGGACRVDWPVQVTAINGVAIKPAATLRCEMAATFASWTRKELVPSARTRYFSGVKTIHQGSSYSCRNVRGSGKPSEHSRGNALDVMRIELNSGRDIDVRKPGWFAFRERGFLKTVRADGCDYFNTVLGPGYDYDHRNHFHFDIRTRRSSYCR